MTELEDKLLAAINKYRKKIEEKPEYKEELAGWTRTVLVDAGEEKYHFTIDNAEVKDFAHGPMDEAEIKLISDAPILIGLLDGEISPMKAYAKKQIKIKASLSDLMKIRKFF
ncbi:MAG: SCP2 sterol-binding domain-containing protein [Candidatus Thermoplasmatota archaeon]|nr:SCP2 sterol-binding domain-containing protein [Candidatus Thermoplasmatota archaeon]